jgi:hypothetical protein
MQMTLTLRDKRRDVWQQQACNFCPAYHSKPLQFTDRCLQSSHVKLAASSSEAMISAFADERESSVLFSKALGCFTANAYTHCFEPRSFAAPDHTLTILSGDLFASSTHLFTSAHLLVSFASESQHGAHLVNLGHL